MGSLRRLCKTVEAVVPPCFVGQRFDADDVEIHQTTPQADDGTDDFEHAIALCVGCHTWPRHYDHRRPNGFNHFPAFLWSAKDHQAIGRARQRDLERSPLMSPEKT